MPIAVVNGTALHYEMQGSGVPIIFIHPPLLTSVNFKYQLEELSSDFKAIAFDIRGHGHSRQSEAPLTFPLIVEDMRQLLDSMRIEAAFICGYSCGAQIALDMMLTYPERCLGGILISGMSECSDLLLRSEILGASVLARSRAWKLLARAIAWSNADSRTMFRDLYVAAKYGHRTNIAQYYRYSLNYRCTDRLKQVRCPVLLVCGGRNPTFVRYGNMLKSGLPLAEQHIFNNLAHQIPTKAAPQLNQLIRYWVHKLEVRSSADSFETPYEALLQRISVPDYVPQGDVPH